jgi:hypothetical protein
LLICKSEMTPENGVIYQRFYPLSFLIRAQNRTSFTRQPSCPSIQKDQGMNLLVHLTGIISRRRKSKTKRLDQSANLLNINKHCIPRFAAHFQQGTRFPSILMLL